MNLFGKEIRLLMRTPGVWLMLAVLLFTVNWVFWQMLDAFLQQQVEWADLPQAPTVLDALASPYALSVAQALLLLVALLTGLSFAQEKQQGTLALLLCSGRSDGYLLWHKAAAAWCIGALMCALFISTLMILLDGGGQLPLAWLGWLSLGCVLLLLWLVALGLWLSLLCQSGATAVLLNVVVFIGLWMLGHNQLSAEWGTSWMQVASPYHHFKLWSQGRFSWTSLWYFVVGAAVFLAAARLQMKRVRGRL